MWFSENPETRDCQLASLINIFEKTECIVEIFDLCWGGRPIASVRYGGARRRGASDSGTPESKPGPTARDGRHRRASRWHQNGFIPHFGPSNVFCVKLQENPLNSLGGVAMVI